MSKLRVLIVDDEELARRGLAIRLKTATDVEVCGQSSNGREALADVAELKPDIVFLDIQMPGVDGFDVLRMMAGPEMPVVIFVTAYAEYAIRAFEANALDYLLKPIDESRLHAALDRAREQLDIREAMGHRARLLKLICDLTGEELTLEQALHDRPNDAPRHPQRLAIKDGRKTSCVDVADIIWIDSAGDYLCIHTPAQTYVLRGTMKRIEQILDPAHFVRVHRSTIVNGGHVKSMRSHTNGEYFLTLDCDKELKLSRTYKKNIERLRPAI
jgi:two-component system LytT family response regulator